MAGETILLSDLRDAVNAECACGGDGPENGCLACQVWHRVIEATKRRLDEDGSA